MMVLYQIWRMHIYIYENENKVMNIIFKQQAAMDYNRLEVLYHNLRAISICIIHLSFPNQISLITYKRPRNGYEWILGKMIGMDNGIVTVSEG